MDLLNCKIKPIYFKYLAAASGSAVIGAFLEWLMQWSSENTTVYWNCCPCGIQPLLEHYFLFWISRRNRRLCSFCKSSRQKRRANRTGIFYAFNRKHKKGHHECKNICDALDCYFI